MYYTNAKQDSEYEQREEGGSQVLLSAKEAVSLWLLGARKVCKLLLSLKCILTMVTLMKNYDNGAVWAT